MQSSKLSLKGIWSVLFLSFFLVLAIPSVSKAAIFNVTRPDDPTPGPCDLNDCSLREAISAANANTDTDNTINLQTFDIYTLRQTGSDDTNVGGDLDLVRTLPGNYTINGNDNTVRQVLDKERVFDVHSSLIGFINLTINDLEITDGNADTFDGGGIRFVGTLGFETLTLNDVYVVFNSAEDGGGVSVQAATLNMNRSTFFGNTSQSDSGGINLINAFAHLNNSTISGNHSGAGGGGGIGGFTYDVKARNITVTKNIANVEGGGFGGSFIILDLKNSILFGNTAPNQLFTTNQNCFGDNFIFDSNGFNILGDSNGGCAPDTDDLSSDPDLKALNENGGFTPSHLYNHNDNPGVNGGDPAGCTDTDDNPLTFDQRGFPRPQGPACDIGSVEMVVCGDGTVGPGEDCEGGDCCTDQCQFATDGTACGDGGECNATGECIGGGGTTTGGATTGGATTGGATTGGTTTGGGTATGGTGTGGATTAGGNGVKSNGSCSLSTQSVNASAIAVWSGILVAVAGMIVLRRRRS
jgi:CSLREA domain-containing protein